MNLAFQNLGLNTYYIIVQLIVLPLQHHHILSLNTFYVNVQQEV